jgi:hypothetical protein
VGAIELRRGDGSWAWRYRDREGRAITSNRVFDTRRGAMESARRSYPGVPVRAPLRNRVVGPRTWTLAVVAGVAGVAAMVVALRRRPRTVRVRRVRP